MPSLEHIEKVVEKIAGVDEIREHIYFFGGAVPYIYYGEESGRTHSDIDILVDKSYIDVIRNLLKESNRYQEDLDSLNLDLGMDYGVKAWIDGIYVEFEPVSIENGTLKRYTFSPEKKLIGTEEIPYEHISDLVVPMKINGKETYCQSNELNKAAKEKYGREKDLQDAEFIGKHDIDMEKYIRDKQAIEKSKSVIISYEEAKKKHELDSMLSDGVINNQESNFKKIEEENKMDLELMNIDGLVTVAKKPGVKNCVRVNGIDDIPDYLQDSITVEGDNLILDCLEGKETVPIGSVIAFEKLDNGKMNVWNKANWRETTKEVDGVFYDIPKPYKAFPVTEELPEGIVEKFGDNLTKSEDGTYELTTSWGVVSCKPNNGYLMIYGENEDGSLSANFLTKGTPSFEEYYISDENGNLREPLKDYDNRLHGEGPKSMAL